MNLASYSGMAVRSDCVVFINQRSILRSRLLVEMSENTRLRNGLEGAAVATWFRLVAVDEKPLITALSRYEHLQRHLICNHG